MQIVPMHVRRKIGGPFLILLREHIPDTGKELMWLIFNHRRGEDIMLTAIRGYSDHWGERAGSANRAGYLIPLSFG